MNIPIDEQILKMRTVATGTKSLGMDATFALAILATLERVKAAESGLPVEPEDVSESRRTGTFNTFIAHIDTLRAYAVQSDVAVKIHAKDVFNLTEKVIPNIRERAEKAEALAEQNRKDAERYRWILDRISGDRYPSGVARFRLPDIPAHEGIFKGSVAQHFTEAIDRARSAK